MVPDDGVMKLVVIVVGTVLLCYWLIWIGQIVLLLRLLCHDFLLGLLFVGIS